MNIFLTVMHIVGIVLNVIDKQYITAMWCLSSLCWLTRAYASEREVKEKNQEVVYDDRGNGKRYLRYRYSGCVIGNNDYPHLDIFKVRRL